MTHPSAHDVLLVLACAATVACGGSEGAQQGFGDVPLVTVTSASGQLQVAVFTNPQPPIEGNVAVRYVVTGAASAEPVDGLSLAVVPWMPAMGHGTSVVPSTEAEGDGVYNLTNVYLFMAGQWQLRTSISDGANDSAAPNFMVQ